MIIIDNWGQNYLQPLRSGKPPTITTSRKTGQEKKVTTARRFEKEGKMKTRPYPLAQTQDQSCQQDQPFLRRTCVKIEILLPNIKYITAK